VRPKIEGTKQTAHAGGEAGRVRMSGKRVADESPGINEAKKNIEKDKASRSHSVVIPERWKGELRTIVNENNEKEETDKSACQMIKIQKNQTIP